MHTMWPTTKRARRSHEWLWLWLWSRKCRKRAPTHSCYCSSVCGLTALVFLPMRFTYQQTPATNIKRHRNRTMQALKSNQSGSATTNFVMAPPPRRDNTINSTRCRRRHRTCRLGQVCDLAGYSFHINFPGAAT